MKKTGWVGLFLAALVLGLLLAGCAGSRTYLVRLSYDASQTPPFMSTAGKPLTVVVYNFRDLRPDTLYLGRRVFRDGMIDLYKPDEGTVEQLVTRSFAQLLEKARFRVVRVNRYLDPQKEDFKDIPADVAFGGNIDTLWVEAKSGLATTASEAKMRLQIYWGISKDKTWVTKSIEGAVKETDRPFYHTEDAQEKLNEVFKDGLDKLLKDESLLRDKLRQ